MRVTVRCREYPEQAARSDIPLASRDEAMAEAHALLYLRCAAIGEPGAADLFDEALASPSGEAVRAYLGRYPAAVLLLLAYAFYFAGMAAAMLATVASLLLRRPAAGVCIHCGYNCAGLAPDGKCPSADSHGPHAKEAYFSAGGRGKSEDSLLARGASECGRSRVAVSTGFFLTCHLHSSETGPAVSTRHSWDLLRLAACRVATGVEPKSTMLCAPVQVLGG